MSSSEFTLRLATEPVVRASLEEIARQGARRALQQAIEAVFPSRERSLPDIAKITNRYSQSHFDYFDTAFS